MVKILVTGSTGQLGQELQFIAPNYESIFVFSKRSDFDISSFTEIDRFIEKHNIEIIINCAAYTGVDKAEMEQESANLVNNIFVGHLANIAKNRSIKLIHISTDYVFNGKKSF